MAAPNERDVYIWYRCTESLDIHALKSADERLSPEERSRRDRFYFEPDRRDFTIAHDFLRRTLSRYADMSPTGWRFVANELGKPSIDNSDPQLRAISFSLSYTPGYVACATTSNAPLGLDIERIDQLLYVQEIADRYFSTKEAAWLRECSDQLRNIRFAELWTLKEAFLKAVGIGLSGLLTCASFRFNEHGRIEFSGPSAINPREWHFGLFEPVYNLRLAIVIRSIGRPRFFIRQEERDQQTVTCLSASSVNTLAAQS